MEVKIQNPKSKIQKSDVRFLYDLKNVLYDRRWLKKAGNFPIYYMYRNVKRGKGLRYDITIIPPKMFGKEFPKTKGHKHFGKFGEIYKVLAGEGIFLMQKTTGDKIKDAYYIKAKKNDYVPILANYGHITINPAKKNLKMANWVSPKCLQDYQGIERKKGACYYYTISGWVKNRNYKTLPKLKAKKPLRAMPRNLNFLHGN